MASVCKWLGFYLCLRQDATSKLPRVHDFHSARPGEKSENNIYDAIIVWKEGPIEKQGGLAYDVILAPSRGNTPKKSSPPRERPLSQEIIEKKLKAAEERRQSMEAAKLAPVERQKERQKEAVQKLEEVKQQVEQRIVQKIQTAEEKRQEHEEALRARLQEHMRRVEEVRNSVASQSGELREKIDDKISRMQTNREAQIQQVQERIKEHERHVRDVIEASQKMYEESVRMTEEKIMAKMEVTLKNREDQLQGLIEKIKMHDKHVQEVREKAKTVTPTEEIAEPSYT